MQPHYPIPLLVSIYHDLTHCWTYTSVDLLIFIPQSHPYNLPWPSHHHVYNVIQQRSGKASIHQGEPTRYSHLLAYAFPMTSAEPFILSTNLPNNHVLLAYLLLSSAYLQLFFEITNRYNP